MNIKKKTKRLAALLLIIITAGCSKVGAVVSQKDQDGKISVISTIFAPYDFAREIAGGIADISMLLPPASESHSYEPTPQDIIKIQNCDVFIYVGGESDEWANRILESIDTDQMTIVTLMDCVAVVEEDIVEGMESDGEDDTYDEHVWTSPKNAALIVQNICDILCEADSANSPVYRQNTTAYLEKLDELDAAFSDAVRDAERTIIVFGDRFPFRYLTDAYGLAYHAAFPGCSTETEPSAKTVTFLINKIKDEDIPVVFYIELSNEKMADTICEATGAKKLLFHACHNISRDDFEGGASYLSLMTQNVSNLKEALH